jgi:predicted lipoprotein with Yx(FWY)xxD motif
MKKNILLIIGIVVSLIVGFAVGLFAGPYILFGGHHFPPGGVPNRSLNSNTPASTVHLQYAVNIATKPGIGQYLVNSTGWALYMYVPDTPGSGKSTCYGQCAVAWPIFYTSNLTIQPGINMSLFGTINRTDGTKELTFNGYPLYYYEYDTGAGNINGQGVGQIWYVMSPSGTVIYNNS